MIREDTIHRVKLHGREYKFTLRTWYCCGLQWELLLSSRYPKRYKYNPRCSKCGKKYERS